MTFERSEINYERRHPGLGPPFIRGARHAMERIAEAPEAMQVGKPKYPEWAGARFSTWCVRIAWRSGA